MSKHFLKSALALGLAASFLVVSTALGGTTARHANSEGHTQQSHSESWCGWMCKASQALEAPVLPLLRDRGPMGWVVTLLPILFILIIPFSPGSRSPPLASNRL